MDVVAVAGQLSRQTGQAWEVEGRCPGGEVGAYFVSVGSRRYVMKWSEGVGAHSHLTAIVQLLLELHNRGLPMPRYELPIATADAVVVFQQRMERGMVLDEVSVALAEELLGALRHTTDISAPSDDWSKFIRSTLLEGADGWCLHQPLLDHSADTAGILAWAISVGEEMEQLPSGDLVHVDLHHRNVLQDDGGIVAVVDWEGAMVGDRVFDLVTFAFNLAVAEVEDGVEERLWNEIQFLGRPDAIAAYVAHMSVRRLDWQIRHHPETVALWVDQARRFRELLG